MFSYVFQNNVVTISQQNYSTYAFFLVRFDCLSHKNQNTNNFTNLTIAYTRGDRVNSLENYQDEHICWCES